MAHVPFFLALLTLLWIVPASFKVLSGKASVKLLKDIPLAEGGTLPKVTAVIPARNESKKIEEGLRSVLSQVYWNLEVIVVDDRSTDDTGMILDRLAKSHTRLKVVHIKELPDGWLGKTHALDVGAAEAAGEYLLFADADVVMDPTVVSRAVEYAAKNRIDFLTAAPELRMPGTALKAFGGAFTLFFSFYAEPWEAKNPKSRKYIGVGAFSLVRVNAYRSAGAHKAIRMRPDDDMRLAQLMKSRGFRSEFVYGTGLLRIEWYSSVGEMIHGLMKNAFAALDYNLSAVAGTTLLMLAMNVWPFIAVWFASRAVFWMNAAVIFIIALLYWDDARRHDTNPLYGLGFPAAVVLMVYIMWRAALLTISRKGIEWRGTFYPLTELRAHEV